MYFDDFLLGFLVCAAMAGMLAASYLSYVKKEEDLQRQQMAIEMLRDLDPAKLRHLLGSADLPPWISFSDFERSEWLTQMLAQLWPYLDSAVSAFGLQRLDKTLKERRARWMLDVAVEQCALGTRAPQVSGVKVLRSAATGGADADDVAFDIEFLWGGNPDIGLIIKPLPAVFQWMGFGPMNLAELLQARVAVRNLVFSGRLHIVLTPLLNSLPVIGAVQVKYGFGRFFSKNFAANAQFAFAHIPSLRFDLRVLGGNIVNLAFVENWLRDVFCSLLEPYTLPDKVALEIVPGVLTGLEKPAGVLKVNLIEAENVPKADLCKWSDPYVVLYVSPHGKLQSTIANTTRHPVWDETFQLLVSDHEQDVLTLLLFDHDRVKADEKLGRADYPVRRIEDGQKRDVWLEMRDSSYCRRAEDEEEEAPVVQSIDKPSKKRDLVGKALDRHGKAHNKVTKRDEPCKIHIQVQYFSFEGGVLERTMAAEMGDSRDRSASLRLVDAARGRAPRHDARPAQAVGAVSPRVDAQPTNGADATGGRDPISDGQPGHGQGRPDRGPVVRSRHDATVHGILSGGVLIIYIRDLEALKPPRFWKMCCLKRLQLRVTVCGVTKTTGYIRLGPHMPDIILVKQEMDYELTGQQVKKRGEAIHIEVWDTSFPKMFMGRLDILLSEVMAKQRLHGEWPLHAVRTGAIGLDMSWSSTLQRLRNRPPRRLGQTHSVQQPGSYARHT